MANVSRLSSAGVLHAFEFDDENGTNFSFTGISTALSSEFDENTSSTLVSGQRMRVESTSVGNVIVFDSIDISDLSAGFYSLVIKSGERTTGKKIIVK